MKYSKEWFNEEEIKKLFSSPKITTRDLLLMKVLYYGAFRIMEVLNSCKEDYRSDTYAYLLLRNQKTDKNNWETQPIPEIIYGDVIRYCQDNNIKTQDYVFQSNRKRRLSYVTVYIMVKKYCKKIGITKEITTHSFRRSRATHLLNRDVSIYTVSKLLRHKDISITQTYLKLSKKRLADEIAKVDNELLFSDI